MSHPIYYVQECPTCGRRLQIRVEYLGRQVVCPHCQAQLTAADPDNPRLRLWVVHQFSPAPGGRIAGIGHPATGSTCDAGRGDGTDVRAAFSRPALADRRKKCG